MLHFSSKSNILAELPVSHGSFEKEGKSRILPCPLTFQDGAQVTYPQPRLTLRTIPETIKSRVKNFSGRQGKSLDHKLIKQEQGCLMMKSHRDRITEGW